MSIGRLIQEKNKNKKENGKQYRNGQESWLSVKKIRNSTKDYH